MKNADMPAIPCSTPNDARVVAQARASGLNMPDEMKHLGLTKREMMAMHIHAALLTSQAEGVWTGIGVNAAFHAVQEADELLAELEKKNDQ